MPMQNVVKIHSFVFKILSGNKILTSFKGHNSAMNWRDDKQSQVWCHQYQCKCKIWSKSIKVFPQYWAEMKMLQTDWQTDGPQNSIPLHTSYVVGINTSESELFTDDLFERRLCLGIKTNSLSNRVVDTWNSLLNSVTLKASSVNNAFKSWLNNQWINHRFYKAYHSMFIYWASKLLYHEKDPHF